LIFPVAPSCDGQEAAWFVSDSATRHLHNLNGMLLSSATVRHSQKSYFVLQISQQSYVNGSNSSNHPCLHIWQLLYFVTLSRISTVLFSIIIIFGIVIGCSSFLGQNTGKAYINGSNMSNYTVVHMAAITITF
jgi:hypothetical protein